MTNYIPTPATTLNPGWSGRNKAIAQFIDQNKTVLDLGCGSKDLLNYVTPTKYCGVDYLGNELADITLDLNSNFIININKYDYCVCSGLLEYLEDLQHFFFRIKEYADTFIFTYWKNANGNIDNLNLPESIEVFEKILDDHFIVETKSSWADHNIYVCKIRNANKNLKLFWYVDDKVTNNCGDIAGPYILKKYGYNVTWTSPAHADTFCVGSIADAAHDKTTILGSGIINSFAKVNPNSNWVWVRGPITRQRIIDCGGKCPSIYGDAAILLPRIIKGAENKKHEIGIISHYVDEKIIKEKYPEYKIISMITDSLDHTIAEITSCKKIVSSSLHGIIIANAYNIPAAWVKFNSLYGDDVKFKDYACSVDAELICSTLENPRFINPKFNTDEIHSILVNNKF